MKKFKEKEHNLPPYKSLKEYTKEELNSFLHHNEEVDLQWLAAICSEILRRNIDAGKKKKLPL